jgi:COP9 signalosome complex subunit 4
MWTRIVRLYLEDDDTVSAETALNKIKNLPSTTEIFRRKPDLRLYYQLSQARILDSRRKFLDASAEYLSVSLSSTVAEEDRLQALSAAIKTAILAPAGPARSRALGRLYKDERSTETEEYGILEKMFLDRLLSPAEVDAFASSLQPHQLAQMADGSTVLTKAVNEHNLLAASRLYENISTAALGTILGLSDSKDGTAAEKAEAYAAKMVQEGRLKGAIDQIDGVVIFEGQDGVKAGTAGSELRAWDHGVQGLVEDVERCAAAVSESFPVCSVRKPFCYALPLIALQSLMNEEIVH